MEWSLQDELNGGNTILIGKQGAFSRKVDIVRPVGQLVALLERGVFRSANSFEYQGRQFKCVNMLLMLANIAVNVPQLI